MAKKEVIQPSATPVMDIPYISQGTKELASKKLEEFMKEECRLVKGIFQVFECPGATQKVTYKKYPTPAEMRKRGKSGGIEPFSKEMTDGCEYEIPLYVARFLNGVDVTVSALGDQKVSTSIGSCSYAVNGFKMQGDTLAPSSLDRGIPVPAVGITKRVKRYGFQSLEFASGAA